MALMDRIDALPDDMKAICASFAYGHIEKGDEPWETLAFRVGADSYRYTLPYWYLAVFEPWDYGSEYIGEVCGVWQEVDTFAREEDYLAAVAHMLGECS